MGRLSGANWSSVFLRARQSSGVNVCPEAWFLQRFGHMPDAAAQRCLEDGTRQHAGVARTTERIVDTDALRPGLLVMLVALAALLLATSTGVLSLGPPW